MKTASSLVIGAVDDMLEKVEQSGCQVVCISALPPFAVGQARSLCKRLRARFPRIAVVVGLWGFAGGVLKAQERVGPSCTDAVCTNLSEAIFQIERIAGTVSASGSLKTQGSSAELIHEEEETRTIHS